MLVENFRNRPVGIPNASVKDYAKRESVEMLRMAQSYAMMQCFFRSSQAKSILSAEENQL